MSLLAEQNALPSENGARESAGAAGALARVQRRAWVLGALFWGEQQGQFERDLACWKEEADALLPDLKEAVYEAALSGERRLEAGEDVHWEELRRLMQAIGNGLRQRVPQASGQAQGGQASEAASGYLRLEEAQERWRREHARLLEPLRMLRGIWEGDALKSWQSAQAAGPGALLEGAKQRVGGGGDTALQVLEWLPTATAARAWPVLIAGLLGERTLPAGGRERNLEVYQKNEQLLVYSAGPLLARLAVQARSEDSRAAKNAEQEIKKLCAAALEVGMRAEDWGEAVGLYCPEETSPAWLPAGWQAKLADPKRGMRARAVLCQGAPFLLLGEQAAGGEEERRRAAHKAAGKLTLSAQSAAELVEWVLGETQVLDEHGGGQEEPAEDLFAESAVRAGQTALRVQRKVWAMGAAARGEFMSGVVRRLRWLRGLDTCPAAPLALLVTCVKCACQVKEGVYSRSLSAMWSGQSARRVGWRHMERDAALRAAGRKEGAPGWPPPAADPGQMLEKRLGARGPLDHAGLLKMTARQERGRKKGAQEDWGSVARALGTLRRAALARPQDVWGPELELLGAWREVLEYAQEGLSAEQLRRSRAWTAGLSGGAKERALREQRARQAAAEAGQLHAKLELMRALREARQGGGEDRLYSGRRAGRGSTMSSTELRVLTSLARGGIAVDSAGHRRLWGAARREEGQK